MNDKTPPAHAFKDGDWAVWTDFPGSDYKQAELEKNWGKGPFQLTHVGNAHARPSGKGALWDIRYFKFSLPPTSTK